MDMKKREEQLARRLLEDYEYVKSLGYNVLGVMVQGSDNYCLSYSGSDIDTKAILIPSFEDFVLNHKPVSTTLILPSNEHIDIKDIRLMHDCFRGQNINWVEILFTRYKYINPEYTAIYQPMFDNAERIAHYNNYKAVNCIAGMVFEKRKAMCHPYEGLRAKIEKYGYDNKQLHHIVRCEEFLRRYIDGTPYAECLIPTDTQSLIDIKASYIYSLEDACKLADKLEAKTKATKQAYMGSHDVVVDHGVETLMNDVLISVLKYAFKKEIGD